MSSYHVLVQKEDGWFVGRVLERAGITTQGRTLDELVLMVRDAIHLMWNERNAALELVLSPGVTVAKGATRKQKTSRAISKRRRAA